METGKTVSFLASLEAKPTESNSAGLVLQGIASELFTLGQTV